MSAKQCLKCGHTAHFEGAPPLACPQCGAIYSKVEEALRTGANLRPKAASVPQARSATPQAAAPWAAARPSGDEDDDIDVHAFARRMRGESLYPTWRKIVGLVTIVWYIVAVVALITGVASTKGSFLGVLAGIGAAAVIALLARVGKELSLMLADLSDAAVRLAARTEARE